MWNYKKLLHLYKRIRVKRIPTVMEILKVKTTAAKGLFTKWGRNEEGNYQREKN